MTTRNPMRFLRMGCGEPLLGPSRQCVERRLWPTVPRPLRDKALKRRSTDR